MLFDFAMKESRERVSSERGERSKRDTDKRSGELEIREGKVRKKIIKKSKQLL